MLPIGGPAKHSIRKVEPPLNGANNDGVDPNVKFDVDVALGTIADAPGNSLRGMQQVDQVRTVTESELAAEISSPSDKPH